MLFHSYLSIGYSIGLSQNRNTRMLESLTRFREVTVSPGSVLLPSTLAQPTHQKSCGSKVNFMPPHHHHHHHKVSTDFFLKALVLFSFKWKIIETQRLHRSVGVSYASIFHLTPTIMQINRAVLSTDKDPCCLLESAGWSQHGREDAVFSLWPRLSPRDEAWVSQLLPAHTGFLDVYNVSWHSACCVLSTCVAHQTRRTLSSHWHRGSFLVCITQVCQ